MKALNFLIFRDFFFEFLRMFLNLKLIYFDLKLILYSRSDMAACGAYDHVINHDHRLSLKARQGGTLHNPIRR